MTVSANECEKCKGTGKVFRKVWTDGLTVEFKKRFLEGGGHPAILAGAPAYRTVIEIPCEECSGRAADQD
jgi:DnaJ-class molecular chaperone